MSETYASSSASIKGVLYEIDVALLVALAAVSSNHEDFRIASNMADAGKFDDVVLLYKQRDQPPKWKFVQTKSSVNRLTLSHLTDDKWRFSLVGLFRSYRQIRASPTFQDEEIENLILVTNATVSEELKEYLITTLDGGLDHQQSSEQYRIKPSIWDRLNRKEAPLVQEPSDQSDFHHFLDKFRLVANRTEETLKKAFEAHLTFLTPFSTNDWQETYKNLHKCMIDWHMDENRFRAKPWLTMHLFYQWLATASKQEIHLINPLASPVNIVPEDIQWIHLKDSVKKSLLGKKVVFQGEDSTLGSVLDWNKCKEEELDWLNVTDVVRNQDIRIGRKHEPKNDYNSIHYVSRTMRRCVPGVGNQNQSESQFLENSDRLVIISDLPGTGKSTLLTSLYRQLKRLQPTWWIVLVDLNDSATLDALEKYRNPPTDGAELQFVTDLVTTNDLERKTFIHRICTSGGIVIMFDSLDEIRNDYHEIVLKLVNQLSSTKVERLYIATRTHLQSTFERVKGYSAYDLIPFTHQDQVNYLTHYWQTKTPSLERDHCQSFASKLIRLVNRSLRTCEGEKDILGIPLQCRMLAEIYHDQVDRDLPEKFDLVDFYSRFIDVKLHIFLTEKSKFSQSSLPHTSVGHLVKDVAMNYHQMLAICTLFPELGKDAPDKSSTLWLEAGLIVGIDHQFIHFTFAHYFASLYLLNQIQRAGTNAEFTTLLFSPKFLTAPHLRMLRTFFDMMFQKSTDRLSLDGIGDWWPEGSTLAPSAFRTAAEEGNLTVVSLLLSHPNWPHLFSPDDSGDTAVHAAAKNGHERIITAILEHAESREFLLTQFFCPNRSGEFPIDLAAKNGHVNVTDLFFSFWSDSVAKPFAPDGMGNTPFHLAASAADVATTRKIALLAAEKGADFKLVLQPNRDGDTPIHVAATNGRPDVCKHLLDFIRENGNSDEMVLAANTSNGNTPIHLAAEKGNTAVINLFVTFAMERGNGDDLDALVSRNDDDDTPLHLAAKGKHHQVVERLLKLVYVENIGGHLLWARNAFGKTAFHQCVISGSFESVDSFLDLTCRYDEEEFALCLKTPEGSTPLHLAVMENHNRIVELLINRYQRRGTKIQQLMAANEEGNTPIHSASRHGSDEVFDQLIKLLADDSDLILKKNKSGDTPIHLAARYGHDKLVGKLLKLALDNNTDVNTLLDGNVKGDTIINTASRKGHERVVRTILETCTPAEPTRVMKVNELGDSPFHSAARKGHERIIKHLLKYCNEHLIDLRAVPNLNGDTPVDLAARYGHERALHALGCVPDKRHRLDKIRLSLVLILKALLQNCEDFHLNWSPFGASRYDDIVLKYKGRHQPLKWCLFHLEYPENETISLQHLSDQKAKSNLTQFIQWYVTLRKQRHLDDDEDSIEGTLVLFTSSRIDPDLQNRLGHKESDQIFPLHRSCRSSQFRLNADLITEIYERSDPRCSIADNLVLSLFERREFNPVGSDRPYALTLLSKIILHRSIGHSNGVFSRSFIEDRHLDEDTQRFRVVFIQVFERYYKDTFKSEGLSEVKGRLFAKIPELLKQDKIRMKIPLALLRYSSEHKKPRVSLTRQQMAEFAKDVVLAADQPGEDELMTILRQYVGQLVPFHSDHDHVCVQLETKTDEWYVKEFIEARGRWLTKETVLGWLIEISGQHLNLINPIKTHRQRAQIKWADLKESTREHLLQRDVNFQGHRGKLDLFVKKDDWVQVLDQILIHVAKMDPRTEISIGTPVPTDQSYNADWYIERRIKRIKDDDRNGPESKRNRTDRNPINIDQSTYEEKDLVEQVKGLAIFYGEAGTGLSSLMIHLAHLIKQTNPYVWVIHVNLSDYNVALKDDWLPDDDGCHFLMDHILKMEDPIERIVFQSRVKRFGRVAVVFKGFESLGPRSQENVVNLIKKLQETSIDRLWITTKVHLRDKLRTELNAPSFHLEPLTQENQVRYLTRFWATDDDRTRHRAEKLISIINRNLTEADFIDTGLQCRMLAEIFRDGDPEEHLDLIDLYDRFWRTSLDDLDIGNLGHDQRHLLEFRANLCYQKLALKVLFPAHSFLWDSPLLRLDNPVEKRVGQLKLISPPSGGSVRFSHQSYVEFFAAAYLVDRMGHVTMDQSSVEFFFAELLVEERLNMVRTFISGLLRKKAELQVTLPVPVECKKYLSRSPARAGRVFRRAAKEGNVEIMDFITKCCRKDHSASRTGFQLALCSNREGNNALHLAAANGRVDAVSWILDMAIGGTLPEKDTQLADLLASNGDGDTPLHCAARKGNDEILEHILKFITRCGIDAECFLNKLNNRGDSLLHCAAHQTNEKCIQSVLRFSDDWNIAFSHLIKPNADGDTPLHVATRSGSEKAVRVLVDFLRPKTNSDLRFLLEPNARGHTPVYLAANRSLQMLEQLLDLARHHFINTDTFLMATECHETPLHQAALKGDETICRFLLLLARNDSDHLYRILRQDDDGDTPLHFAAFKGHENVIRLVLDFVIQAKGDLNAILCPNKDGDTPAHVAALFGRDQVLIPILEVAKRLNLDFRALLGPNSIGDTPIHIAATEGYANVIEVILRFCNENGIADGFLYEPNNDTSTPFHLAVAHGRKEVLGVLLAYENGKAPLLQRNNDGHNLVQIALVKKYESMLEVLLTFVQEKSIPCHEAVGLELRDHPESFNALVEFCKRNRHLVSKELKHFLKLAI